MARKCVHENTYTPFFVLLAPRDRCGRAQLVLLPSLCKVVRAAGEMIYYVIMNDSTITISEPLIHEHSRKPGSFTKVSFTKESFVIITTKPCTVYNKNQGLARCGGWGGVA